MKLLVKNKVMSLGGSSVVLDMNDKDAFIVKGEIASASKKKWIMDLNKKKLFLVRNKIFHGLKRSCLIYDENEKLLAEVKETHLIKNGFEVTGTTEKIVAVQNGFGLDINMNNKYIGRITPKITGLGDSYEVDIVDEEDAAFLVALAIANDNIHDADRKHNH